MGATEPCLLRIKVNSPYTDLPVTINRLVVLDIVALKGSNVLGTYLEEKKYLRFDKEYHVVFATYDQAIGLIYK